MTQIYIKVFCAYDAQGPKSSLCTWYIHPNKKQPKQLMHSKSISFAQDAFTQDEKDSNSPMQSTKPKAYLFGRDAFTRDKRIWSAQCSQQGPRHLSLGKMHPSKTKKHLNHPTQSTRATAFLFLCDSDSFADNIRAFKTPDISWYVQFARDASTHDKTAYDAVDQAQSIFLMLDISTLDKKVTNFLT